MEFDLNEERQDYLNSRGKVILNACPGSGKTTCLVKKLSILQTECFQIFGQSAGIACLSFTNVAKEEILSKYKKLYGYGLQYPNHVSTIDSFLNQFVTLPFFHLISSSDVKRPKIIDDDSLLYDSLKVRYRDGQGIEQYSLPRPINSFKTKDNRPLHIVYEVDSIRRELGGTFTYSGKLPSSSIVDATIFQEYGKEIFKLKIKKGILSSTDSAYIALGLITKFPNIGKWLMSRFPYFIIDEAQDNSAIQYAFFDKLIELGLQNIELIGDPYQSLYEWRDAKPELFVAKQNAQGWQKLFLSMNRRSNQRIVNCFSIIRSSQDAQITSQGVTDSNIPITIYKYSEGFHPLIVKDFEKVCQRNNFNKTQIVSRGNEFRDKMLGVTEPPKIWKQYLPYAILEAKDKFDSLMVKSALKILRRTFLRLEFPDILPFHEFKELDDRLEYDTTHNAKLFLFAQKIPLTSVSFEIWSAQINQELSDFLNRDLSSHFEFRRKLNGYRMVDLRQERVDKYYKASVSLDKIPITTIHQVKGATLDAILVFLDATSAGQQVSFSDFTISNGFPNEKRRLIYVACSRPQQFLAIAVPSTIADNKLKARFGNDIDIVSDLPR